VPLNRVLKSLVQMLELPRPGPQLRRS